MRFPIQNRWVKRVGYGLFFIFLFDIFLLATFPADRFLVSVERFLSGALDRDVRIGDLDMSLTGALVFTDVEISVDSNGDSQRSIDQDFSPEDEEEDSSEGENTANKEKKKLTYLIEEAVVDVGFLPLLFKKLNVEVDIEAFDGTVNIQYDGPIPSEDRRRPARPRRQRPGPEGEDGNEDGNGEEEDEKDPLSIAVVAEEISLGRFYGLRSMLPVPVSGVLDFEMELESETGNFAQSAGFFTFKVTDLTLSKKGYEADVMDMKMGVPPLAIASVDSKVSVKEGKGEFSKFDVKSKHFDASVEGSINFADPIIRSRLDIYLKFRLLPEYINKSESFKTIMSNVDMMSSKMKRAHRDDDYYGFRYQGQMGTGRFVPEKDYSPEGSRRGTSRASRRARSRSRTRQPSMTAPSPDYRPPSAFSGGRMPTNPVPIVPPGEDEESAGYAPSMMPPDPAPPTPYNESSSDPSGRRRRRHMVAEEPEPTAQEFEGSGQGGDTDSGEEASEPENRGDESGEGDNPEGQGEE